MSVKIDDIRNVKLKNTAPPPKSRPAWTRPSARLYDWPTADERTATTTAGTAASANSSSRATLARAATIC
jgi:hypothetical protein